MIAPATAAAPAPTTLSVSLVTFRPDLPVLRATLEALHGSLTHAADARLLGRATFWLVDNGSADPAELDAVVVAALPALDWLDVRTCRGHGNVGYGRGHNIALTGTDADYHLVLNPDAIMAPDAIAESLRFLAANPDAAFVSPQSRDENGDLIYLCKRYPSVLMLGLRGFAPGGVKRMFKARLDDYERRDLAQHQATKGVEVASGCYMFLRTSVAAAIGGFDPNYFMYFEDTDLSLRIREVAAVAYVPAVRIVHLGGHAAKKGLRHNLMFFRSALTFFRTHGWRLW